MEHPQFTEHSTTSKNMRQYEQLLVIKHKRLLFFYYTLQTKLYLLAILCELGLLISQPHPHRCHTCTSVSSIYQCFTSILPVSMPHLCSSPVSMSHQYLIRISASPVLTSPLSISYLCDIPQVNHRWHRWHQPAERWWWRCWGRGWCKTDSAWWTWERDEWIWAADWVAAAVPASDDDEKWGG